MIEKNNFIKAFNRLSKNDGPVVKEGYYLQVQISQVPSLFYMRMCFPTVVRPQKSGPILECNQQGTYKITVFESVFRSFGLDAWAGKECNRSYLIP